jgi:hypothetical protein
MLKKFKNCKYSKKINVKKFKKKYAFRNIFYGVGKNRLLSKNLKPEKCRVKKKKAKQLYLKIILIV